jgi:hypothetical protein
MAQVQALLPQAFFRTLSALQISDKYSDYNFKTVILSDSLYDKKLRNKKPPKFVLIDLGIQNRRKYENFVKEITPPQFESLSDMSKYIVLNKSGEVFFVSTYKDSQNEKGKADESLLPEKMKRFIEEERNGQ